MSDRAEQAKSIFLEAIDKHAPDAWPAYLDNACADDAELRGQVEKLLQAQAEIGSFQEEPRLPIEPTVNQALRELPGTVIGPYKLLQQIGEGGMGVVWMAEQTQPVQRKVALKVIKPGMDSRQVIARFEAERQALAIMDHVNIARVFDGGATENGRPFFVMELVHGVPITKYCDDNHLTPRERLELFVPVCQAIQHAHQKGIIHRDIKPSNVMVTLYDGKPVPKVIDFGVAKATEQKLTERTLFTQYGTMVGTLEYMSPEQAEMSALGVDTRSDIYSLGVLLYELLTGSTPLTHKRMKEAAYAEILRMIKEEEPPRPSTRLSDSGEALASISAQRNTEPAKLSKLVRGELDWIVMKTLEKDRNRRYETANGFAMDVQRYLADEPVVACPPSAGYRLRKFVRRNRTVVIVAGLFAVLLLVGITVSTTLAVWAVQAEGLAESRLEIARDAEREKKRQLVGAKLAQARAGRRSREIGQRFDGLQALTEAAALARELEMDASVFQDLRDEAVACLALTDVRPHREPWEGLPPGSTNSLGFDADLHLYARCDPKGTVDVRQIEGDRLLARLHGQGSGGSDAGGAAFRFSPDSNLLAVVYRHQIPGHATNMQVWDWQREQVVFRPPFSVSGEAPVAFSPNGQRLALGQADGTVTIYEVDGWKEANRLKVGVAPACLAYHPTRNWLAVTGQRGGVEVWDAAATGKLICQMSSPSPAGGNVAWHPDGNLLAAGCYDMNVHLWDGRTGEECAILRGHQNNGIAVAFAAGGDLLVSSSWDGSSRLWDPWTGRELLRLPGDAQHVSRDGRRLASRTGHSLAVWQVAPRQEYLSLPCIGFAHSHWSVSLDDRWLVTAGERGRVWDLARRKELATLPGATVRDAKVLSNGYEFLTAGLDGVFRWSIQEADGVMRIRPIDRLMPPGDMRALSVDRDERQAAVAYSWGAKVFAPADPSRKGISLPHGMAQGVALSPDGRWIATGTHNGFGVRIWDARSGKRVTVLVPEETSAIPVFSPDGRWLLTTTGSTFGLWEPGTWRPSRQIAREQSWDVAAAAAFSRDGKVLAVAVSLTTVQLFDTETWRPLVRLQGPDADTIDGLGFTSDGSRLQVGFARGIHRIWDLRRVHEQLAEMGLDWDPSAHAPAPPARDTKQVHVVVDTAAYERLTKADPAEN